MLIDSQENSVCPFLPLDREDILINFPPGVLVIDTGDFFFVEPQTESVVAAELEKDLSIS